MNKEATPSNNSGPTYIPRRRRTVLACESCRNNHVKCVRDEGQESCKRCIDTANECTFNPKHSWQTSTLRRNQELPDPLGFTSSTTSAASSTIVPSASSQNMYATDSADHVQLSHAHAQRDPIYSFQTTRPDVLPVREVAQEWRPSTPASEGTQLDGSYPFVTQSHLWIYVVPHPDESASTTFSSNDEPSQTSVSDPWAEDDERMFEDIHKDIFGEIDDQPDNSIFR